MKKLKTALRQLIKTMGYEVRKIHHLGFDDAIAYNKDSSVGQFYSDPKLVQHYIDTEVKAQISNVTNWLDANKIDLTNKKILDAGCGTGHCLAFLGKTYLSAQLFGTEYTPASLALAQQLNENAKIRLLSIYDNWDGQTFDAILCQLVLEHLEYPETAVATLWAMLNENGFLYLAVPDGRQDYFAGHIHFWSKESLGLWLQKQFPNQNVQVGMLADGVTLFAYLRK